MTAQLYLVQIPKYDVTMCDMKVIDSVVPMLDKAGPEAFQRIVLHIEGFEDDPRPLYDIQEVRVFMASLFEKYPHFLYYVTPTMHNIMVLLACMGTVESGGMFGLDPTQEHVILDPKLIRRMTNGLSRYGIDHGDTLGTVVVSEFLKKYFISSH